jgi:hypothetical protein
MRDLREPARPEALLAPTRGNLVLTDGLPLERLYVRFDTIARGRAPAEMSALRGSMIDRLAATRRCAEAIGWTDFVTDRASGSGRLELSGASSPRRDREIVPDMVPHDASEATAEVTHERRRPAGPPRHIDAAPAKRRRSLARMRWNDDGGR